jgi:hypothetical protein
MNANAALNKWVDNEGNIHYSDQPPPPNVKAQTFTTPSAASGAVAQKTFAELDAERKKAQKLKEETELKSAQQQEVELGKQKNCSLARNNFKTLESNLQITTLNDKGESVRMDSTDRQQGIEEARKQISLNCN